MRYDKEIYFVKNGEKTYNPDTGNYETEEPIKTLVMASVSDTGATVMQLEYGKVKQDSLTIHTQNFYDGAFDHIEYLGKRYSVDRSGRAGNVKGFYIVSEAQ